MMVERTTALKVIVALDVIGGVLAVLGGLDIMIFGGAFYAAMAKNAAAMGGLFAGIAGIFGFIFLIGGIVSLVIAWGLWNLKPWARIVASIFYVFGLLGFPIGTIISLAFLYFLWVDKATKSLFD